MRGIYCVVSLNGFNWIRFNILFVHILTPSIRCACSPIYCCPKELEEHYIVVFSN